MDEPKKQEVVTEAQDKEKMALREPTEGEWRLLLGEHFEEFCLDRQYESLKDSPPQVKCIDRKRRKQLIDEKGLTYILSGKNAGKIGIL